MMLTGLFCFLTVPKCKSTKQTPPNPTNCPFLAMKIAYVGFYGQHPPSSMEGRKGRGYSACPPAFMEWATSETPAFLYGRMKRTELPTDSHMRVPCMVKAILLRAQMNVTTAKAKVKEKKDALEKADQEQRILDLLDYADKCQQLAVAMSMEADWAFLAAAAEAADYVEKNGE